MVSEQPFTFVCEDESLVGILTSPPEGASHGVGLLIVVGGPQYRSGSHRMFTQLARVVAAAGVPAMRFDLRGMGDSSGKHPGFENTRHDIAAAVREFKSRAGVRSVMLWGLCDGASAAALYDPDDSDVGGVVLLNPWVSTPSGEAQTALRHYYRGRLRDFDFWKRLLTGRVQLLQSAADLAAAGVRALGPTSPSEGESLADRMAERMGRSGRRAWILLSTEDGVAKEFQDLALPSEAWQRAVQLTHASLDWLEGADHTLSERSGLEDMFRLTLQAVERHSSEFEASGSVGG